MQLRLSVREGHRAWHLAMQSLEPTGPGMLWPPIPDWAPKEKKRERTSTHAPFLKFQPEIPHVLEASRRVLFLCPNTLLDWHVYCSSRPDSITLTSASLLLLRPPWSGRVSSRARTQRGFTWLHMCCDLFSPTQALCKLPWEFIGGKQQNPTWLYGNVTFTYTHSLLRHSLFLVESTA